MPERERNIAIEAWIEGVDEPVARENVLPVAPMQLLNRGFSDLGREGDRGNGRRRSERSVVVSFCAGCAACSVSAKRAQFAGHLVLDVRGPVDGGPSPNVGAVILPAVGIGDRIVALGMHGAAAVLEVIDAAAVHVWVADRPEIDPDVAEHMAKQGGESEMRLAEARTPIAIIAARPCVPCAPLNRIGGRAERQEVDDHRLVVALPVVRQKTGFGQPAMTDGRRVRLGPLPVNSAIDRFRQRADLLLARVIAVEVGLAEQHAGE